MVELLMQSKKILQGLHENILFSSAPAFHLQYDLVSCCLRPREGLCLGSLTAGGQDELHEEVRNERVGAQKAN